jgi:hypothetical protein
MSDKFFCTKKGGIRGGDFGPKTVSENVNNELIVLEGTRDKGPWYNAFEFSDEQIEFYKAKGWIEFVGVE